MTPSTRPATKIELKYGVTTDFPDLGLHAAAVTNNVGLAHYALTHGQPENSVLHGILPLHAASSGGSEAIVRMLIERGADVNAPRLPRRYSNDGKKTPSVGVSGSGPLHFAASNGHLQIVKLLLSKGGRHDMKDKHGLMPEDLALAAGHEDIVQTLRAWGTLRASLQERDEEDVGGSSSGRTREQEEEDEDFGFAPLRSKSMGNAGKKGGLGVKRSLDNFVRGRRSSSSASTPVPGGDVASIRYLRHASSKTSLSPSITSSIGPQDSALDTNSPIESSSSSIHSRRLATDAPLTPLPSHMSEPKSRRPSLPSILEKAAHSLAHPHRSLSHNNSGNNSSQPSGHSLGRTGTFNSVDESDSGSISSSRKFTSNRTLLKMFHRTHLSSRNEDPSPSPPSASPSPPSRLASLPIFDDDEDVDRTIEAIRRQSFDGASTRGGSLDLPERARDGVFGRDDVNNPPEGRPGHRPPPPSAPAAHTTFHSVRNRSSSSSSVASSHYVLAPQSRSHSNTNSPDLSEQGGSSNEKSFYRPRKGSEVVSPSPLAAEWSMQEGVVTRRRASDRSSRNGAMEEENGSLRPRSEDDPEGSSPIDYSDDESGSDPYRSSASTSTRPEQPSYPPSSPGSSYRNASSLRQPPLSSSPSKLSFANSYGTSSTDRPPPSAPSSNTSSLRKVASANLRRGDGGRPDSGDPYAPSGSIYGTEAPSSSHPQRSGSLDDDRLDEAREHLWAERGYDGGGPSTRKPGLLANATARAGRSRGASFTSTVSSVFSTSPSQTSPALTPPRPSLDDEDYSTDGWASTSAVQPAITVSVTSPRTGRSRNVSVSSVSSNTSGRGGHVSASTNGTSYSAPSLLSSGAYSTSSSGTPAFPPVPEHPNSNPTLNTTSNGQPQTPTTPYTPYSPSHSNSPASASSSFPPSPRRVSSRAEARDLVKAAEKSILDRPASSDSTLSLSAQLAAYGEKLAIEREFARGEEQARVQEAVRVKEAEKQRRKADRSLSLDTGVEEDRRRSRSRGEESQRSGGSGEGKSGSSRAKGKQVLLGVQAPSILNRSAAAGSSSGGSSKGGFAKHVQDRSTNSRARTLPPNPLITVEAPPSQRSSIPNVAQIYSNRAEALRKKGIAVASAISSSPLASTHSSPLSSPTFSSSSRRPSHPPNEGDRQLWIISGHGTGAGLVRTPPTPEAVPDSRWTNTRKGSLDTVTSGGSHHTHTHHHSGSPLVPPPPPSAAPSSITPSQSVSNRGGSSISSSSAVPPTRLIPPINTTSPLPPPSSTLSPPSTSLLHPPPFSSSPSSHGGSPRRVPSPKPSNISTSTSGVSTNGGGASSGLAAVPKFEIVKRSAEGGEVKAGKEELIGLGLGMKEEVAVGLGGGKNSAQRKTAGGMGGWGTKIFGRRG